MLSTVRHCEGTRLMGTDLSAGLSDGLEYVFAAPWLRRLKHHGDEASVVIESERGTTTIEAETVISTFMVMGGVGPGTEGYPVLQQAVTRFVWDGEVANGMMERSLPGNLIEP